MAKRLALLIGNKTFVDKDQFPDLNTPTNDVNDFADLLMTHGDFEILGKLIDEDDRRIMGAIEDLYNQAARGDLVLLYYSGHGFKDKMGRLYLVAKNTQANYPLSTGVYESFIHDAMSISRSQHRVIILDCCFSGAFIKGQKSGIESVLLEKMKGEASVILVSSSKIQASYEENYRNSLFTHHLLEGISTGKADKDQDGWISIEELFDYIDPRVREERPEQTPMIETVARQSKIFISRSPGGLDLPSPDQEIEASDWIYAYNFDSPNNPLIIRLPAGKGISFKHDVEYLFKELRDKVPMAFSSQEYHRHKQSIEQDFKEKSDKFLEEIQKQAEDHDLTILRTPSGLILAPFRDGRVITPDEFGELSPEDKRQIENHVEKLQWEIERWTENTQLIEREKQRQLQKIDEEIVNLVSGFMFDELRDKYPDHYLVSEYLGGLKRDIIMNIDVFRSYKPLPKDIKQRYEVNVRDDYEQARMWAFAERYIGNYEKARELFARVVQINPQDVEAWRLWVDMEKEVGNKELSDSIRAQIASLNLNSE
jgi:uncharacterized caspase-like protein